MRHVLAADIGGTNARFAVFSLGESFFETFVGLETRTCFPPPLELERAVWLPTAELTDAASVMAAFRRALDIEPDSAVAVAVAVAGPVDDGRRGSLTNGDLRINLDDISATVPMIVLNDFLAQAYACASRPGQAARPVLTPGGERRKLGGVRAVVGAGTGLGAALLCESAGSFWALPSEVGHADFPFVGEEENRLQDFICRNTGLRRASGDVTLTGRGLTLLHYFLTGEKLSPREVSRTALRSDTPTLRWYSRLYGRFCRNVALAGLCAGGLWIAGGIAADNPLTVTSWNFAEEFFDVPHFGDFLRGMPILLMDDKNSGLWGAACAACLRLTQSVS
jgi:glucokinase